MTSPRRTVAPPQTNGQEKRERPEKALETELGEPPVYAPMPDAPLHELNLFQRLCILAEWVGGLKKAGVYKDNRTTYNFHAHDDVADVIRLRLARLGIDASTEIPSSETTIFKGRVDQDTGIAREGFRTVVSCKITLTNADNPDDHQDYIVRMTGQGFDDKDHSKAGTLAQKYFWVWKLNLGNAEDPDSEKQDDDVDANISNAPEMPEGVEKAEWERLAFLAKSVAWGPKKVKARVVHHGGAHDGYLKTLAELQDEHSTKHGPDCAHIRELIDQLQKDDGQVDGQPAQTKLL